MHSSDEGLGVGFPGVDCLGVLDFELRPMAAGAPDSEWTSRIRLALLPERMKAAPGGFNNFQNAICMKNAWSKDQYENKVLWMAIHKKGRIMSQILNFFRRGYFKRDREVIRELGNATSVMDFQEVLSAYKKENDGGNRLIRKWFNCRISGSQLMKLGVQFFP